MSADESLLELVEAHLAATGISPSRFGKEAVGDPGFVFDLRAGREPRRRIVAQVVDFMQSAHERASPPSSPQQAA